MNNSFLELEEMEEKVPDTSEEEVRLTRLIESISGLIENKDWQTLVELHFSKEEERVKRLLLSEAQKNPVTVEEIHSLQGELKWARRYKDFIGWAKLLKSQLEKIKHG